MKHRIVMLSEILAHPAKSLSASDYEGTCSICGQAIATDKPIPLCAICEATARAAGKQMANERRFPGPGKRS